jgi:hypothetical protein
MMRKNRMFELFQSTPFSENVTGSAIGANNKNNHHQ